MKWQTKLLISILSLVTPNSNAAELSAFDMQTKAIELAKGLGPATCSLLHSESKYQRQNIDFYKFNFKFPYKNKEDTFFLYRIPCWTSAYNLGDAFVLFDEFGEGKTLTFAKPTYAVTYDKDGGNSKVVSIKVTGYVSRSTLGLSDFDSKSLEALEYLKLRGLGDAFTSGVWKFNGNGFVLKTYQVDAAYDGKNEGITIVDFSKTQPGGTQ